MRGYVVKMAVWPARSSGCGMRRRCLASPPSDPSNLLTLRKTPALSLFLHLHFPTILS